jgi:hypothetical protein
MPARVPVPGVGRRELLGLGAAIALAACGGAPAVVRPPPPAPPSKRAERYLDLPPRPSDAPTGSGFLDRTATMRAWEREKEVEREVLLGNVPEFMRALVPLTSEVGGHRARVFVIPDYLSLGTDDDYVRMPITIRTAKHLCKAIHCVLPTKHLVDVAYREADARVTSPTEPATRQMGTNPYIASHNASIEERRRASGAPLGALVAGCKKDVVLSSRMLENPGRTPIYGWFRSSGEVIQPLSLVHDDRHVDYAHGIRLVDRRVEVDGADMDFFDVLRDRQLAKLISDEGAFDLGTAWDRF